MAIVGIICEYNPLHLGHMRQFSAIRQLLGQETVIVCLMSGNFVQRGEPAVFPETVRARAAVDCGADLVLEMPVTGSLRSAEGFARCGVEILSSLGCDYLCFGCERADADSLMTLANAMMTPSYERSLRSALCSGCSYAAARQEAAKALGLEDFLLRQPNDTLGLEYCKAMVQLQSPMQPLVLNRPGSYHDEQPDGQNPSATSLRLLLEKGEDISAYVPQQAARLYRSAPRFFLSCADRAMLAVLRTMEPSRWQTVAHGSEGLWSKAMRMSLGCPSVEAVISAVKSKRYVRTRITRLLLCAFLGISDSLLNAPVPYVRILGFDEVGKRLLHEKADACSIPLRNLGAKAPACDFAALEERCSVLYPLFAADDGAITENSCIYHTEI